MSFQVSDFTVPEEFSKRYVSAPEVRPPRKSEDVRVHREWIWPGVAMVKSGGKLHLVHSGLFVPLTGKMSLYSLRAAISSEDGAFVWAVRLDMPTAIEAAEESTKGWCNIAWDLSTRSYKVEAPQEQHEEPTWPFESFEQLLELALSGRTLKSLDDPVVQKILGKKAPGNQ